MNTRTIIAGALTCALAAVLGGCGTISAIKGGTAPDAAVISQDIAALTSTVQTLTIAACAFQPDEMAIAQIVSAGDPAVATANAIATVVCAAANKAKVSRKAVAGSGINALSVTLPSGRAVLITGEYTK